MQQARHLIKDTEFYESGIVAALGTQVIAVYEELRMRSWHPKYRMTLEGPIGFEYFGATIDSHSVAAMVGISSQDYDRAIEVLLEARWIRDPEYSLENGRYLVYLLGKREFHIEHHFADGSVKTCYQLLEDCARERGVRVSDLSDLTRINLVAMQLKGQEQGGAK